MNEDISLLNTSGENKIILQDKNDDEILLIGLGKEEDPASNNDGATLGENLSPPKEYQIHSPDRVNENDMPVSTKVN